MFINEIGMVSELHIARRIASTIASYLVGGRVGMDEVVFGIYT